MATSLGVFVGNRADELPPFERFIGRQVDAVLGFTDQRQDWGSNDPAWMLSQEFLGGTGRHIRWSIPLAPDRYGVEGYRAGARGNHNERYDQWATKCLNHRSADAGPIYVRPSWELGGEWFEWTNFAKADPKAFIDCTRQFSTVFKRKSNRFKLVWDTVPDRGPQEHLYPGDDVVDVIGMDVYWHLQYDGRNAEEAFKRKNTGLNRGLAWLSDFARRHNKPMAIPELGVPGADSGVDGARYLALVRQFCAANDVLFMDYWNSKAAYDGLLHDNNPQPTAQELRKWYVEGTGIITPPPIVTPPPQPDTPTQPATHSIGTGDDAIVLRVAQDHYQGDAQCSIKVDDVQVGSALTIKGRKAQGQVDVVTVKGNWPAGKHSVTVTFLNDAGGIPGADRNLYLESVTYKDTVLPNSAASLLWTTAQHTVPFTVAAGSDTGGGEEPDTTVSQRVAFLRNLADGIESGSIVVD